MTKQSIVTMGVYLFLSLTVSFVGWYLFYQALGFKLSVALFLILWGNNASQKPLPK